MEVIVAKNSGFCFGVKRAVDMVYSQIGHGNIYTFGPVIHNEEVIKDLENNGVKVINSVEEAADVLDEEAGSGYKNLVLNAVTLKLGYQF